MQVFNLMYGFSTVPEPTLIVHEAGDCRRTRQWSFQGKKATASSSGLSRSRVKDRMILHNQVRFMYVDMCGSVSEQLPTY